MNNHLPHSPALLEPVPAAETETQLGAGKAASSSASKPARLGALVLGLRETGAGGVETDVGAFEGLEGLADGVGETERRGREKRERQRQLDRLSKNR